ncbi:hypothetical protein [Arcticibacterium luteifluviistationis]|uniref:hypothetical protein n=1 Tax=Arcticibacterium luteifluviistationis TaxID=1784714 RepID=UPI0019550688|nr:hypothetical protein [Arcticibacterium luteifluviistationis]
MTKYQPYNERLGHSHDFEVEYRILNESEGGRKTLPYQGIRWDFWYEFNGQHENQLFMIWPEFLDSNGNVITKNNVPVPASGIARMWIVNDSLRKYHQDEIKVGLNGNGHEGGTVVAKYVVSKIVGLMTNPTKE